MRHHYLPLLTLFVAFAMPNQARADEPPGWQIGSSPSPTPPPPPPAPVAPAPTTFEVEQKPLYGDEPTRMYSPVVFGIGAVLGGGGALTVITALAIRADATEDCTSCPAADKRSLAFTVGLIGAAGLLIGIPAMIVGGRQVPDKPSWARAIPDVYVAPRGGALRWTF